MMLALGLANAPDAFAQASCPTGSVVEIDNITSTATDVWTSRQADRRRAFKEGRESAKDSTPGRVQSLTVSVAPEFSLEGVTDANEYLGAATLAIELGNLAESRRRAIDAEWTALDAELDVERWAFVDEVQNAYLTWRQHELERTHLEAYLAEANKELEPIRAARDRQLISRLDLADLNAEVAWISAELADATRRSKLAQTRLNSLLGVECPLAPVPATHEPPDRENPWHSLSKRAEAFPEIRAYDARRATLEARAEAHEAANPWLLEVGVGARSVGFDENFLGPVLGLTIPMQATEASDAAVARAEARAMNSAGEWAAVRIRSELVAEASNFDVLVEGYFVLVKNYVEPLKARAQLMDEAFKASHIEIDRLIRARRELHEAEHKLILHRAEIDARRLKANAVQNLLTMSGTTGEKP